MPTHAWIAAVSLALVALPARARPDLRVAERAPSSLPRSVPERECSHRSIAGRCLPAPRCAVDEFDLDGMCVALQMSLPDDIPADVSTNAHVDRAGRLVVYEHIPRRPDLPGEYDRYTYPVPPWHGHTVTSGYDLDRPDALQRRGAELSAVGHGGVDLPQERGTPVTVVALRGQVGDADVAYAGPLFGTTVVLRHVVREGGTMRTYLALHGHLDAIAPGLSRGQSVPAGTLIGFVGDTGAVGLVHLHYETRLVRTSADPMRVENGIDLIGQSVSVPCDPRNVLPLAPAG